MSLNESRIEQARRDLVRLRERVARASKTIGDERAKAARERMSASKSRSPGLAASHTRQADAAEAKALKAEKDRASLDADIARTEKRLYDAEVALDRERSRALERRVAAMSSPRPREIFSGIAAPAPKVRAWDFFVSHASPDKEGFVRPLAAALQERGAKVWFDEFELKVGDSIRRKIDEGLANSRFGIVVLTPAYLAGRPWTENELDGLFAAEKRILPIWHHVSRDEVSNYSPIIAERVALVTALLSLEQIVDQLIGLLTD